MDVREKMIKWREDRNLPLSVISKNCGVSSAVLGVVERGGVTHPNFVKKIQELYKLTDDEADQLMPECHRKSSPNYDPEQYKVHEVSFAHSLPPLQSDVMSIYVREHSDRIAREKAKKAR